MSGEDLERADTAQVAPVVAVRGCYEHGVVVGKVLGLHGVKTVGENDVVFGETFFGRGRGRNDDRELGPKPERENWAVFL